MVKPYEMYVSAPSIEQLWHARGFVMEECGTCGMDNAIIVIHQNSTMHQLGIPSKCKYCAELENLNFHLKYNGHRKPSMTPDQKIATIGLCIFAFVVSLCALLEILFGG